MARKALPPIDAPEAPPAEASALTRAEQAKLAELQSQASAVLAEVGLPVEYSFDAFVEIIKTSALQLARSSLVLGSALLAIRANEPAVRFQFVLDQIGMGTDSAYAAMTLARQAAKSDAHRRLGDALGATKALTAFRHLTDEQVSEIAYDDETLAEFAGMSVRELAAELRRAKQAAVQAAEDHEQQLIRKDQKINTLDAQLHQRTKGDPDQALAAELITEYDAVTSEAFRAFVELHRITDALYTLRRKADHVLTPAINQKLVRNVGLLAESLSRLQAFEG